MLKKHSQFWEGILIVTDIVLISVAWILAYYLRFFSGIAGIGDNTGFALFRAYVILLLPIIFVWPFIFRNMGLYRPRRVSSSFSEVFDIVRASTLAVLILVAASFFLKRHELSRLVFLYFWGISIALLSMERWSFRVLLRYLRRKGYNSRRVLVIGAGDLGGRVVKKIKENSWTGLDVVGYLDDYKPMAEIVGGIKILGRINDLKSIITEYGIEQVFVALPVRAHKRLMYIAETLKDELVTIRIVPDIYQAITLNASVEELEGLPLINLTDTPMYGWNVVVKRFADILFSSLALIIIAPLMALIALMIKLTSPGPVFFKQRRYGLDGKVIWVYKFRSMSVCEDGPNVPQAQKCDPRVTPLGVFLRRTSLDELPQFINVLKGDMSIVGPRPHAVAHNEYYRHLVKGYMLRHKVKPGITGWAQINGWRGETDTLEKMEKRIDYDLYYIENWSVWLDIKIMWLTVWKGLVNKNAY